MAITQTLNASISRRSVAVVPAFVIPTAVLVVVAALCFFMLDTPAEVFRSPDENSEYLFTRAVSENSLPYYEDENLLLDEENLLHPRGALTHDGRTVPVSYLGLPVLYGVIHKLVGTDVRFIILPLAVMTVAALAGAGTMLTPARPWLAWLAVLALSPVLFYLTRPYVNATPAFALTTVGFFFLMRYFKGTTAASRRDFLAGSVFLALASFVRYELAIFAALFVLILLVHRHHGDVWQAARRMAVFLAVMAVVFFGPVMVLNYLTYGNPSEFGYSLFNAAYFPERSGSSTGGIENLFTAVRGILLPAYPIDSALASRSLFFQVLGVVPVVAVIAIVGLVALMERKEMPDRFILLYGAWAFYVFFYRGAGESWLAGSTTPNLEASIIRYSLPLYIAIYCLAVYALSRIRRPELATAAVVFAAVAGLYSTIWYLDGNLNHIKQQLESGEQVVETRILPNTEPDSLIYTDVYDKLISSRRDVATWWGSANKSEASIFQPENIVESIARNISQRPVYLLIADIDYFLPQFETALGQKGLTVEETPVRGLYGIVQVGSAGQDTASR